MYTGSQKASYNLILYPGVERAAFVLRKNLGGDTLPATKLCVVVGRHSLASFQRYPGDSVVIQYRVDCVCTLRAGTRNDESRRLQRLPGQPFVAQLAGVGVQVFVLGLVGRS